MPIVTGELHRPQARSSPVNFTEYPRFLMPVNNGLMSSPTAYVARTEAERWNHPAIPVVHRAG
jgi:hypothetical protein